MADQENTSKKTDSGADEPGKNENKMPEMDTNLVNPLDVKEEAKAYESEVLKNIVTAETSEGPEQILEDAPEIDAGLLEDVAPGRSLTLLSLKILFGVLLGVSLVSIIFFTSQLSDRLDSITSTFGVTNVSEELKETNAEVIKLQTSLNFYRYLELKARLDQLSFYGDSYIHFYEIANSQTASSNDRRDATDELIQLRPLMREAFMEARDKISEQFVAPLIDPDLENQNQVFEQALVAQLGDKAREFANISDLDARRDQKNYQQTIRLVGNQALKNALVQTDFDSLGDIELYELIGDVNRMILNDLSIIQKIKNQRVKWSDVMQEIELRTIAVDRNYSDNFYDQIGGIRYTSYDFDKEGPSISIIGETKRFDTTNFTMISNLIDSLNSSDLFANAEMRTFSKSGSLENGYTASLRLNLDLLGMQDGEEEPQNQ